jgi:hypothetical protein
LTREVGAYGSPSLKGRAHATEHHYVAERFFDEGTAAECGPVFETCPWNARGRTGTFCYECHEMLLHNPVVLPANVISFARLVQLRGLDEVEKDTCRRRLAGRVQLLNEVIRTGLEALLREQASVNVCD